MTKTCVAPSVPTLMTTLKTQRPLAVKGKKGRKLGKYWALLPSYNKALSFTSRESGTSLLTEEQPQVVPQPSPNVAKKSAQPSKLVDLGAASAYASQQQQQKEQSQSQPNTGNGLLEVFGDMTQAQPQSSATQGIVQRLGSDFISLWCVGPSHDYNAHMKVCAPLSSWAWPEFTSLT